MDQIMTKRAGIDPGQHRRTRRSSHSPRTVHLYSMERTWYCAAMPPSTHDTPASGPDLRFLFSELVRLETELWDAVEGRLRADFGVTLPVFEFLQVISRNPACRVNDIVAELSITVGGASKIVDRIEASGYCARNAHPGDRRSSIITLTPA